jgi:hypothetical protein
MSQLGKTATEMDCPRHVGFTPVTARIADIAGGPVRANCGLRKDASESNPPHTGRSTTRLNHWALIVAPDDVLAEDKESSNGRT